MPTAEIIAHSFGQIVKSGEDNVTFGLDFTTLTVVVPLHKFWSITNTVYVPGVFTVAVADVPKVPGVQEYV